MASSDRPLALDLSHAVRLYVGVLRQRLERLELDRYYYPLLLIAESPGLLSQQQLAEALNTDKVTALRIVRHLQKRGYVYRKRNQADQRGYLLEPREKALHDAAVIREAICQLNAESLAGLGGEAGEQFAQMLSQMIQNLSALPHPPVYFTLSPPHLGKKHHEQE
jgi:DNA-binding MarR family transcriptional regulator